MASESPITLPKGGGAVRGIGETFAPDLHSGTGNYSIPISVLPGRNGFQPQLALTYSSGNGNGPFGLGWALGVAGISRRTSKGVPRYDASDIFVLSGAEELVPVERSATSTRYQPRTEGLFARIYHRHNAAEGHDYWEVATKDGLISRYGTPRPVNAPHDWADPAIVANPNPWRRSFIAAWKLTETVDPFGNRIVYEYERDAGAAGPHLWDQVYLKRVRYADYTDSQGVGRFLVSIAFVYGDREVERSDAFSDYRAGFEIRTRLRCRGIEIETKTPERDVLGDHRGIGIASRDGGEVHRIGERARRAPHAGLVEHHRERQLGEAAW